MLNTYYSHSLVRRIERNRNKKKYKHLIDKNSEKKILVILHLYYKESWREIREYLLNLQDYKWVLYVTVPVFLKDIINEKDIRTITKDVEIFYYENIGYDIGPFFDLVKKKDLSEYDAIIKLQSKGVHRKYIYIYDQLFFNRDWFLNLYEGVIGAAVIHKTIDCIINDKDTGLVAADNLLVKDPPHKQELTEAGLRRYSVRIKPGYWFVAGTCFAIKPCCLNWIKTFPASIDDFYSVPSSRGFGLAHILERYFSIAVQESGYKYESNRVMCFKRAIKRPVEKILEKYSSVRLYDLPYKYDPEFFFWIFDNKFVKYRVRKVKLRDLVYKLTVGGEVIETLPLESSYPFRYLNGDKKAYFEYCDYHEKMGLPLMSEERFSDLCHSIKEEGYDKRYIIIVSEKNEILDGQHRACYLAYINGMDFEIDVLEVVKINKRFLKKRLLVRD